MKSDAPLRHSCFTGFIGAAREDITPPIGIYARNWGAAKHDVAEGIHHPLTLTCLTFQSSRNEKPLVLMGADLGWWKSSDDEKFLRNEILKALSLDASQLMFCLSHTHAGPSLCREDADKPGGKFIEPYLRHLQQKAIHAAQSALSTATPAALEWRYGKCDLATCRDLPETGKKRFLVGFNPTQTADETLLVGRVTDQNKRTLATIVNYACHPTTLAWENRLLSPDYPGAMREVVETETKAPCLFLQGASGELAPAEQYTGDLSIADAHGRRLGHAVLSTLEGMLPPQTSLHFSGAVESGAPLAIWQRCPDEPRTNSPKKQNHIPPLPKGEGRGEGEGGVKTPFAILSAEMIQVDLPLKPLPPLAEIERRWRESEDRVLKERLWRQRMVRKTVGDGQTARVPLWIWRLGDSLLAGQPNEAYSEFQLELRQQLKPNAVAVMNVVNGHVGYLPPRKLYSENLYAVWQTPFEAGSLELLMKIATESARRLANS